MIYTVTFNPAIDYVVRLEAPLEVGEVNRAAGEDCVLGGKGINVSGVLAQLGCGSVALGFVAGETGAWLVRGLAAQGMKTDFLHLEQGGVLHHTNVLQQFKVALLLYPVQLHRPLHDVVVQSHPVPV